MRKNAAEKAKYFKQNVAQVKKKKKKKSEQECPE